MARSRAGNLPLELTSFVGRRREIAEGRQALAGSRMLTLVGVGGVGKTRLALRIAAEMSQDFRDGRWMVDLSPLPEGGLLTETVAAAVGCPRRDLDSLAGYLHDKRSLLVLDNCEHLPGPCAALAGDLLAMAPELRVLATSRQALRVAGERVLDVPPLTVPEAAGTSAEDALRNEAVRLFEDRAAGVVHDFTVNDANCAAVVRLCRRLDGIPLAIELAAVRVQVLSVEQILKRLDDRFRLLTTGPTTAPARQKTLRALLDWSYDLCSEEERRLWERLSVFSGGCCLDAAEAVCSGDGIAREHVLDLVARLVDKSIVRRRRKDAAVRFEMLDTLSEYGAERLAASGRDVALRRRHRDWCRDLAVRSEAEWFGEHQMDWLACLVQEQGNVRAALEFCLDEPGEAGAALEIAAAMWSHRLSWSSPSEGHLWLERALARAPEACAVRAKALWVDAWLVLLRGDGGAAGPLLEECRALAERLGDEAELAGVAHVTGFAALQAGEFARAFALLEDALARRRALGEWGHAWVVLYQLAMAAVLTEDRRATELCEEALKTARGAEAEWSVSYALWAAALDRRRRGAQRQAVTMMRESLRLKLRCNDHLGLAQGVEALAWILADGERYEQAAQMLGAAHMLWRSIGTSLSGLRHLAGAHERCESCLREHLREGTYRAAFDRGRGLTLDQVAAFALNDRPEAAGRGRRPGSDPASVLTRREREIAELVARGLSNKEIAETLVISQRTAECHVENILRKLNFTSRSQVAKSWAGQVVRGSRESRAGSC
ncbi:LuxR family transcriptional regulator [Nonomuraea phyllanthi]|uniref:LuxR C-terminal-related transcriptional regulator n=1 Tax=Nonomuraea phyllanthi TaxID=2219224 RepID=UPI001293C9C0|nr:LuxR C-terminal-related transcriptional regulator [Nonomuraea phyllanthi]QFY11102.1 LuxR family transcriptional regulator [Nonomuraea phyllanthi]